MSGVWWPSVTLLRRSRVLRLKQTREHGRVVQRAHAHRLFMPADLDLGERERTDRNAREPADLFRNHRPAAEPLAQVLQSRRDVHRVAQRREYRSATEADVADDHLAGMDADAVLNGLDNLGRELVVQLGDVRLNQGRSPQRLPA